jgi:hypothetical protein
MDYYATTAQVIPVLLLALVWESGYLPRLKTENRANAPVWTKRNVRLWGLFMSAAAVFGEIAMFAVLADIAHPADFWKGAGLVGVAALLGSLCVRLCVDILNATAE